MTVDPKIASAADVKDWFENALKQNDPRPSEAVYLQVAEELKKSVNRYRNQSTTPDKHRDAEPSQYIAQAQIEVTLAANKLLFSLERLGELLQGGLWTREADGIPYAELADFLRGMAVSGNVREAPRKLAGKPKAGWHTWGRPFCSRVEEALRNAGYSGNLNRTDRTGVIACIGASMVQHVCDLERMSPETFADAMANRRPSRARRSPGESPQTSRLKQGPYSQQ
ncbi:hypothetical protein [Lichenicoccus roseus]|uniref:Uncharacterized protein n=1 Tax=Lichenicoccus roseus TaxID=2683649 RepID=A0A5R9J1C8_9PROT|nr:hypothetical protein [Lichenicoccus roseus]TLU71460.1 hypothetical protein FE263_16300 [Lichenicoccus roseus]